MMEKGPHFNDIKRVLALIALQGCRTAFPGRTGRTGLLGTKQALSEKLD